MIFRSNTEVLDEDIRYVWFLNENETDELNTISSIPIISTDNGNLISYSELNKLVEDYDISLQDAYDIVLEENGINSCMVSVDEADIIMDPSIANNISDFVVNPVSEYSFENKLVEAFFDEYERTENEKVLDILEENFEYIILNEINKHIRAKAKQNAEAKKKARVVSNPGQGGSERRRNTEKAEALTRNSANPLINKSTQASSDIGANERKTEEKAAKAPGRKPKIIVGSRLSDRMEDIQTTPTNQRNKVNSDLKAHITANTTRHKDEKEAELLMRNSGAVPVKVRKQEIADNARKRQDDEAEANLRATSQQISLDRGRRGEGEGFKLVGKPKDNNPDFKLVGNPHYTTGTALVPKGDSKIDVTQTSPDTVEVKQTGSSSSSSSNKSSGKTGGSGNNTSSNTNTSGTSGSSSSNSTTNNTTGKTGSRVLALPGGSSNQNKPEDNKSTKEPSYYSKGKDFLKNHKIAAGAGGAAMLGGLAFANRKRIANGISALKNKLHKYQQERKYNKSNAVGKAIIRIQQMIERLTARLHSAK